MVIKTPPLALRCARNVTLFFVWVDLLLLVSIRRTKNKTPKRSKRYLAASTTRHGRATGLTEPHVMVAEW